MIPFMTNANANQALLPVVARSRFFRLNELQTAITQYKRRRTALANSAKENIGENRIRLNRAEAELHNATVQAVNAINAAEKAGF